MLMTHGSGPIAVTGLLKIFVFGNPGHTLLEVAELSAISDDYLQEN